MPWRGQIGDQFRMMPGYSATSGRVVDRPRAGFFGNADHAAVDMFGHAGDHVGGRRAWARGPVLPDQIVEQR